MAGRSKNVPIGKTITLTNLANNRIVWANPHGMLCPGKTYEPGQNDDAYLFKLLDRGNGKVALQALNGTGFATITGQGLPTFVCYRMNL